MNDRLTPILVKELRQGIRSHLFTGSFLLVQALLFLFGLSFLTSTTVQADPSGSGALFWAMVVLPLFVLVPISASQAIEKEVTGRTLELLLLTRLSSYRIVLGKWASIVLQTSLLLVSALPYVMLRYFLGGIDVVSELETLGILLLGSALLAGAAMGFWALHVPRLVKWAAVLLILWASPVFFMFLVSPHGGLGTPVGLGSLSWIYGAILMLMMIEAGAGRIGPPSANHRTRLRLLGLLALGAPFFFEDAQTGALAAAATLVLVVPIVVGSLGENAPPIARLYQPFVRGSALRRMVSLPFAPSWPGGLAFTGLALAVLPFVPAFDRGLDFFPWMAIAVTVLFPAALVRGLIRPARPVVIYLVIVVLTSLPVYVYAFSESAGLGPTSLALQSLSGFAGPLALTVELAHPEGYVGASFARTTLVLMTGVSLLVTAILAHREWRRIVCFVRAAEEKAP